MPSDASSDTLSTTTAARKASAASDQHPAGDDPPGAVISEEIKRRHLQRYMNVAALVWSGLIHKGVSKEELWDALPEGDKKLIEAFVRAPKQGPSAAFSACIDERWLKEFSEQENAPRGPHKGMDWSSVKEGPAA